MTIIIKTNENEQNDLAIIEVQGDLESRTHNSLFNQFVGDLHFSKDAKNTPILIIGHHILHGKIVSLEKPFAVLKKIKKKVSGEQTEIEYIVQAIVRKKILFNERPKPIIANISKTV